LTKDDLYAKFFAGVRKIAALSLAIGYPTVASVPHIVGNAFRKLLYIGAASGYEFKEAKAFLAGGGGGGGGGAAAGGESKAPAKGGKEAPKEAAKGGKGGKAAPKEEPKEEEPVEEDDGGGMAGLFGDE